MSFFSPREPKESQKLCTFQLSRNVRLGASQSPLRKINLFAVSLTGLVELIPSGVSYKYAYKVKSCYGRGRYLMGYKGTLNRPPRDPSRGIRDGLLLIFNDYYHWPIILLSLPDLLGGPISPLRGSQSGGNMKHWLHAGGWTNNNNNNVKAAHIQDDKQSTLSR